MKTVKPEVKRKRDKNVTVWFTGDEYDQVQKAAEKEDRPVSTWARRIILKALAK